MARELLCQNIILEFQTRALKVSVSSLTTALNQSLHALLPRRFERRIVCEKLVEFKFTFTTIQHYFKCQPTIMWVWVVLIF